MGKKHQFNPFKSIHTYFFYIKIPICDKHILGGGNKEVRRNSVRNLMCVGRYAEMMELSEAKRNHFEMPATEIPILCIPAECDTTSRFENTYSNNVVAFRWNAYLLCDICRHFASVMLHFASLITHNLRCIPAYTHQIPTGFFQSLLNFHKDNLYIISIIFRTV